MKLNNVGEPVFTSKDLIKEIYKGNLDLISSSQIDLNDLDYMSYLEFIENNNLHDWPVPHPYFEENKDIKSFDSSMQNKWYMSNDYTSFDIEDYLYSLCNTEKELNRVKEELYLYNTHNMLPLLRFLKYLVETMRENNILWGVGRGSSVASYCLYLLGVHKIDSIKYELDIKEFLR